MDKLFRGNGFELTLEEGWQDQTVYILVGPVADGIQHNITVNVDPGVEVSALIDYADWQIRSLEEELKGCRLLVKGDVGLQNGMPAYRAIYTWYPAENLCIYQEQIYVLYNGTGFKLTASFTRNSRKTLGPEVEQMMLSFEPRN